MKDNEEIWNKLNNLAMEGKFSKVIEVLNSVPDIEERVQLCFEILITMGTTNAIDKYGGITIYDNIEDYEQAKSKLSDMQAKAILYKTKNGKLNTKQILDFIPENHRLRVYYEELVEE